MLYAIAATLPCSQQRAERADGESASEASAGSPLPPAGAASSNGMLVVACFKRFDMKVRSELPKLAAKAVAVLVSQQVDYNSPSLALGDAAVPERGLRGICH